MINITICDEDFEDRNLLEELCRRYINECGIAFDLKVYSSGDDLLADKERIDILILSNMPPKVDGIKIKEEFEEQGREAYIIFTSECDLLVEMIGTNVSGFARKPVEYDCLCRAIDKILRIKFKHENAMLLQCRKGKKRMINIRDVVYVESSKPYIVLYFTDGDNLVLRRSLKQFEEKAGTLFARAGRKFVVNLEHVKEVSEYVVLDNGTSIKLSKSAKVELKSALEQYLLKKH